MFKSCFDPQNGFILNFWNQTHWRLLFSIKDSCVSFAPNWPTHKDDQWPDSFSLCCIQTTRKAREPTYYAGILRPIHCWNIVANSLGEGSAFYSNCWSRSRAGVTPGTTLRGDQLSPGCGYREGKNTGLATPIATTCQLSRHSFGAAAMRIIYIR